MIAVSLGILLGGAGTGVAASPGHGLYGKFSNLGTCQAEGRELVHQHHFAQYHCEEHRSSPVNERWWLFVV